MLDQKFAIKVVEEENGHSKIEIEPLYQGYGHTLGIALRRVLLRSLGGAAVTSVKIKGVKHQFTTLEGMSEDIVQFILNLKNLRVKVESGDEVSLTLEASGPGEIKASQINTPAGVSISNPDLVIAHLADKSSKLMAEIKVERGQGYSLAEERGAEVVGEIPVDALFSPVRRVNSTVTSTRVGRRTDFDKLTMEIWTDGTITGKQALEEAAQILTFQFTQIFQPEVESETEQVALPTQYSQEILRLTVEELDLPTRIANALRKGGYKTVNDLITAPRIEIVKVKNLGERSVKLVEEALSGKGVTLED